VAVDSPVTSQAVQQTLEDHGAGVITLSDRLKADIFLLSACKPRLKKSTDSCSPDGMRPGPQPTELMLRSLMSHFSQKTMAATLEIFPSVGAFGNSGIPQIQ